MQNCMLTLAEISDDACVDQEHFVGVGPNFDNFFYFIIFY